MCVIAYKPAGIAVDYSDLSDQWDTNPDGAGLAYWDKGKVIVDKGHMQKDTFFAALCALEDREVVYHLRLATHGLTNRHQTHPFVVDRKVAKCKSVTPIKVRECVFHNGVLSGLGDDSISDTVDLVSSILADLRSSEARLKVLQAVAGKYAYFADGEIYLIGGYQSRGDLKYSNVNWTFSTGCYSYGRGWKSGVYGGNSWKDDIDYYEDWSDERDEETISKPSLQVVDGEDLEGDSPLDDCLLDGDYAHAIVKGGK